MEPAIRISPDSLGFDPYASVRGDSYVLLAALLGRPPSEGLIKVLQGLEWGGGIPEELGQALQVLRLAAFTYPLPALEEEYEKLFIGLGCGAVVPYASWYKDKRIQSMPLVPLRSDLIRLGIVRQRESHESEDHAAALCEIMALVSQKSMDLPLGAQANFFREHIDWWLPNFFKDLLSVKRAEFYRKVGLFGRCFIEFEKEFLGLNWS